MILYHFTCPWQFWGADWKSGYAPEAEQLMVPKRDLIPSNRQYDCEELPARWRIPIVWLTSSAETKPAEAPNIMRLRLTVRLPSLDPRLGSYGKWAGPWQQIMPQPFDEKARAHWWTYRGVIPANRIVEAELLSGQLPWWEMPSADGAAEPCVAPAA
jgi:hypothetical protein